MKLSKEELEIVMTWFCWARGERSELDENYPEENALAEKIASELARLRDE